MNPNPKAPSNSPTDIFISYRRRDTAGHAGRLEQDLSKRFPGRVFMDIHNIEAGRDFTEVIAEEIGKCGALIVMIGDQWLGITDPRTGKRRLDDPNDLVAGEISEALKRNTRVIPVLVEGARMPQQDELPAALAGLVRRNAFELSDTRWEYDVEQLGKLLEKICGPSSRSFSEVAQTLMSGTRTGDGGSGGVKKKTIVAIASVLIAGAIFGVYLFSGKPLPQLPKVNPSPSPASSPPSNHLPTPGETKHWQAVVSLPKAAMKSQAEFVFPFVTTGEWAWSLKESEVKEVEYRWDVVVRDEANDMEYTITVYLEKSGKSRPRSGNFKRLIADARSGVWIKKGDGEPELKPGKLVVITPRVLPNEIRLFVRGPGLKTLFAGKPRTVTFKVLTPKDADEETKQVEYK